MPSIWTESVPKIIKSDLELRELVLKLAKNDDNIKEALAKPIMFLGFPLVDLYYEAKKTRKPRKSHTYSNKKSH